MRISANRDVTLTHRYGFLDPPPLNSGWGFSVSITSGAWGLRGIGPVNVWDDRNGGEWSGMVAMG